MLREIISRHACASSVSSAHHQESKYIKLLIVLSLACKSIISSTSDGTKRSLQWFVVTAVSNIEHRSFNTTVNIKHVVNFSSNSS